MLGAYPNLAVNGEPMRFNRPSLSNIEPLVPITSMAGFSTSDIGPALQAAFAHIHAGTGRGTIVIPNGQNVLVTPVAYALANGERITIQGESEDAAIVFNCGATNNGIDISHGVSTTGLFFGVQDLVIRGFADGVTGFKNAIKVDMNVEGEQSLKNVICFGCNPKESVIRLEDGTANVDGLTFIGCSTDSGTTFGLIRFWQTYRGEARHIYHFNTGSYNGTTWNGSACAAMVEWQAPQLNFGGAPSNYPRGNFYLDEWKTDSQCTNAILINNSGTFQGGKVTIMHGQTMQPLSGSSDAPILVRGVDELLVDSLYASCANAGSGFMVYMFAVTKALLINLHGETAADGGAAQNCNLIGTNNVFGNTLSVDIRECQLGTTCSFVGINGTTKCGIDADPTVTRVTRTEKGVRSVLRKASAAIPANSLVCFDPAAGTAEGIIVAPASAGSSDPIGVSQQAAAALNDLITVVEFDGEQVTMLNDGAGVIAPGDALKSSGATAGQIAKNTTANLPCVGHALTGATNVGGTAFKARFGKFGK